MSALSSSAASSRRRMSSACRWVPVFSKMLERWALAVALEMPRRRAAAARPSPFKISAAIFDSAMVRPKRRRRLASRRRRSMSGSRTVTIATGVPTPIQGTSASRALERSGVTVTARGERGSSRGILSSPPGPPSARVVWAHEAISFHTITLERRGWARNRSGGPIPDCLLRGRRAG